MNLGATELLIVLAIVLLIFGSTRLPRLARSLGQARTEFHRGETDEPPSTPDEEQPNRATNE